MQSLPSVVFQHYRDPQNQGALPDATACGRVDGRREDSELRLYLKVDEDTITAAQFEVVKDKSCAAGLSLLTTYLTGRPLAEAEALTVEQLAAAYGLHHEQLPMLVPVLEALEAALAALHSRPSPFEHEGALVCHCLQVREGRIRRAIRQRGLKTVDELRFWTRACSGCRSCRTDLDDLLAQESAEG